MIDTTLADPGLLTSCLVRLGDGSFWEVHGPDDADLGSPQYRSILGSLGRCGDPEERQLAETVLAIYLLTKTGGRRPAEIRRLLGVGADPATREELARDLRRVAAFHLAAKARRGSGAGTGSAR